MLISSKNTLTETLGIMFAQISRQPTAQSSWHIKLPSQSSLPMSPNRLQHSLGVCPGQSLPINQCRNKRWNLFAMSESSKKSYWVTVKNHKSARASWIYGSLSSISYYSSNYQGRTEGGIRVLFDINLKSSLLLIHLMDLQVIKFTQGHFEF